MVPLLSTPLATAFRVLCSNLEPTLSKGYWVSRGSSTSCN